jgi:putative addiction module component
MRSKPEEVEVKDRLDRSSGKINPMSTQLPIDQMTVAEKLRIMEELWDDLRTRAADIPIPAWHKDLLNQREQLVETGEATFSDWDVARKRITDQIS